MGYVHRIKAAALIVGEALDLRMLDGSESAAYLREVCQLLWPPPAQVTLDGARARKSRLDDARCPAARGSAASPGSEFILIPFGRRPPLVVPAPPRLAAAAIRHRNAQRTWRGRVARRALSAGLASGLAGTVVRGRMRITQHVPAETIESYLRASLARDLQVSMFLGGARANRKPVLQLLSPAGDAIGFAKIGLNSLTRDLVRGEHAVLTRLERAGLSHVKVPKVLHFGEWHDLDVLVLTALPMWLRPAALSDGRLAAAMVEVARVGGLATGPLAASSYYRRLTARLAEAGAGLNRQGLLKALDALVEGSGDTELTYGAWHGDWSPWNMANTDRGLLVWDWERFECDVPVGFDALHHWLQTEIGPKRRESSTAAAECSDRAAQLIAPFGIGAAQARLTAALYMADLATRYLVDRQDLAGGRLGDPGTWLIPAIAREAARLPLQATR